MTATAEPARSTTDPVLPFPGLEPFDEALSRYFFGRKRDARIVVANLESSRLTLLYGPSAAGKSSVRLAGAVPALRAESPLPDDLAPATLRSTNDLVPGDHVVAVGFPFGIGPSATAGVISGLKREYRSREGKRILTNLIQFDAAANPGNSGGPLVTAEGEVVGIVTGILNPTPQNVFIGIGFAVPIENAAAAAGLSPF